MSNETVKELIDRLTELNVPDYKIQCIIDISEDEYDGFVEKHAIGTGLIEIQTDKSRETLNLFFESAS
jgi:hypothetical protein